MFPGKLIQLARGGRRKFTPAIRGMGVQGRKTSVVPRKIHEIGNGKSNYCCSVDLSAFYRPKRGSIYGTARRLRARNSLTEILHPPAGCAWYTWTRHRMYARPRHDVCRLLAQVVAYFFSFSRTECAAIARRQELEFIAITVFVFIEIHSL